MSNFVVFITQSIGLRPVHNYPCVTYWPDVSVVCTGFERCLSVFDCSLQNNRLLRVFDSHSAGACDLSIKQEKVKVSM